MHLAHVTSCSFTQRPTHSQFPFFFFKTGFLFCIQQLICSDKLHILSLNLFVGIVFVRVLVSVSRKIYIFEGEYVIVH
ncbi:hypothetical protein V1511DRAFT_309352 [Dipodascopsis uninucleata]